MDQGNRASPEHVPVVVTDVQVPFWSMVVFMVKASLAAIPALIIVVLIWTMLGSFLAGLMMS